MLGGMGLAMGRNGPGNGVRPLENGCENGRHAELSANDDKYVVMFGALC
jgi:hypothetical protein